MKSQNLKMYLKHTECTPPKIVFLCWLCWIFGVNNWINSTLTKYTVWMNIRLQIHQSFYCFFHVYLFNLISFVLVLFMLLLSFTLCFSKILWTYIASKIFEAVKLHSKKKNHWANRTLSTKKMLKSRRNGGNGYRRK